VNRQSRFALVTLIVLGLLALFWLGGDTEAPSARPARSATAVTPTRGGRLVASLRSEPRSFNRLVSRDSATEAVSLLTHARLVRVNRATQELEPWLAERWTSSPDGLVHTFTLREGLRWSDGAPFTSDDVTFTFGAVLDPAVKSILAGNLQIGDRPMQFAAPDERTVVVTFPRSFGPGVRVFDNLIVLPKHRLAAALAAGTLAHHLPS
jgi:peptide/nickel transport system substrate-binding protein